MSLQGYCPSLMRSLASSPTSRQTPYGCLACAQPRRPAGLAGCECQSKVKEAANAAHCKGAQPELLIAQVLKVRVQAPFIGTMLGGGSLLLVAIALMAQLAMAKALTLLIFIMQSLMLRWGWGQRFGEHLCPAYLRSRAPLTPSVARHKMGRGGVAMRGWCLIGGTLLTKKEPQRGRSSSLCVARSQDVISDSVT